MCTSIRLPRLALIAVACMALVEQVSAGPVNINSADAATLARELKGVGLARAQAIVEYRTKHGPFRSADELALVKGIGPKAIENNRANIRVDARAPAPAATGGSRKPTTAATP